MRLYHLVITVSTYMAIVIQASVAAPGYHINDDKSAERAALEFAGDSGKFRAAVYQASLDGSLWRLVLASHRVLEIQPDSPTRQCNFAHAYWSWYAARKDNIPLSDRKKLSELYEQAVKSAEECVGGAPRNYVAHLTFGDYLMCAVPGVEKVPRMISEYRKAVKLAPDVGITHKALGVGYLNSGDYSSETLDNAISELKKALELDPRQTYCNLAIAIAYNIKKDPRSARPYFATYIKQHPEKMKEAPIKAIAKAIGYIKR